MLAVATRHGLAKESIVPRKLLNKTSPCLVCNIQNAAQIATIMSPNKGQYISFVPACPHENPTHVPTKASKPKGIDQKKVNGKKTKVVTVTENTGGMC